MSADQSTHVTTVEQAFAVAGQIIADPRSSEYARAALESGVNYEVTVHIKPMIMGGGYTMDVCRYERRPKIQIVHLGRLS